MKNPQPPSTVLKPPLGLVSGFYYVLLSPCKKDTNRKLRGQSDKREFRLLASLHFCVLLSKTPEKEIIFRNWELIRRRLTGKPHTLGRR